MMIESFWDVIIYTLENEHLSPKKRLFQREYSLPTTIFRGHVNFQGSISDHI